MGIRDVEECRVYDEVDGTEIDDDECLAAEWKPAASSPLPSPVVSPASTAVSKPVTAISFDASPVSAGAGSVIINEAEGSGEMSEYSIDGYDNWMEADIDIITSTPNTKDPSEDKPAKQQDEIAVPEQDKEAGETSKDYVLKRSLLGELEGSEIKKKKVDGKDLVLKL